jgi:transcriptional regulator
MLHRDIEDITKMIQEAGAESERILSSVSAQTPELGQALKAQRAYNKMIERLTAEAPERHEESMKAIELWRDVLSQISISAEVEEQEINGRPEKLLKVRLGRAGFGLDTTGTTFSIDESMANHLAHLIGQLVASYLVDKISSLRQKAKSKGEEGVPAS